MNWIFLSFITIFFWGIGGCLGKVAGNQASGFQVYLFEAIGTISVALIYFIFFNNTVVKESFSHLHWKLALPAYGMGALGGIAMLTFILALNQGKASIITPLTAMYPIVTVIFALALLHESLSIRQIIGVIGTPICIYLLTSGGK